MPTSAPSSISRSLPEGYAGSLRITRTADVEGDDNRGWRADLLQAFVDGEPAGYALSVYIPQERLAAWYPHGAWDWLRLICGRTCLPEDPAAPEAEKTLAAYRDCLGPPDQRRRPAADLLRRVAAKHRSGWESFRDFNLDRPRLDFIRVYEGRDTDAKVWGNGKRDFVRRPRATDFRGLGLGHLLYRETARWLAERDLALHASGLLSPMAEASWARLRATTPKAVSPDPRPSTAKDGKAPLVLDGRHVRPWLPRWSSSATLMREDGEEIPIRPKPGPADQSLRSRRRDGNHAKPSQRACRLHPAVC